MPEEHEKLIRMTVYLEEEVIDAIEQFAVEYTKDTGKKWSRGAVIRLALSEFCARRGVIV